MERYNFFHGKIALLKSYSYVESHSHTEAFPLKPDYTKIQANRYCTKPIVNNPSSLTQNNFGKKIVISNNEFYVFCCGYS